MDATKLLEKENVMVYKNVKETGRLLGVGSFGSVVELSIKGAGKFAGKKMHNALVVDGDATILIKECKLMSKLIHPNIAKFHGVCKLPTSPIPVLMMELMEHSLEDVIENVKEFTLSFSTSVSIFIDIANGLAYLHGLTPRVLHRDLTARNVLVNRSMSAKITDFGNSRMIHGTKPIMTQAPGTLVYMPPEALDANPKYSDRLDIFSFGHLALYTLIREFPKDLLPATYISNRKLTARNEVERRSPYLKKLNATLPETDHQLYKLTLQCLDNDPSKRPISTKLIHQLEKIRFGDFDKRLTMRRGSSERSEFYIKNPDIAEYEIPLGNTKTGLIEKKSGKRSKTWKAYSFTIDYMRRRFQYIKNNVFETGSPIIRLDDITEIKELRSEGNNFPFEVHFKGKQSPWELKVYTEAERQSWLEALQGKSDTMKQKTPNSPNLDDPVYEVLFDHLKKNLIREYEIIKNTGGASASSKVLPPPAPVPELPPDIPPKNKRSQESALPTVITQESVKPPPAPVTPVPNRLWCPQPVITPEIMTQPATEVVSKPPATEVVSKPHYIQQSPNPTEAVILPNTQIVVKTHVQKRPWSPLPVRSPKILIPPNIQQATSKSNLPMRSLAPVNPSHPLSPQAKSKHRRSCYENISAQDILSQPSSMPHTPRHSFSHLKPPENQWLPTQPASAKKSMMSPGRSPIRSYNDKYTPLTQETLEPEQLLYESLQQDEYEFMYEDIVQPQIPPQLPPPRPRAILVQADEPSAELEKLHMQALYISISTLSGIKKIGEGQFGEVYKAQMDKTIVAIKVIKRYSSTAVMEQFKNEMSIMSQVSHHNIVRLHGIMSEGPFSPALVMEFLPHGDLKTFLKKRVQPEEFLMKCMSDVAMGMHYLCEKGLIHRDLAARNVLVDKNRTCKVSDFGLLREVPKDESIYVSQGGGQSPLRWMAPESISDNIFSEASDVWSYGVLQWEMFNPNKNPYHDTDDFEGGHWLSNAHP